MEPAKGLAVDFKHLRVNSQKVRAEIAEGLVSADLSRRIDQASTISLGVLDPHRTLLRSGLLAKKDIWSLDGMDFAVVGVDKAMDVVTLVCESAGVAALRKIKGPLVIKAHTITRVALAERLVKAGGLRFLGESRGTTTLPAMKIKKDQDYWSALQDLASEKSLRCFEDGQGTVYFGSDEWLLGLGAPITIREHTLGVDNIDFNHDEGKKASTATVTAEAALWASRPGAPVQVADLGVVATGKWLVEGIDRSLFFPTATISLVRKTKAMPEKEQTEAA